jgi:hypothetical protein
MLPGVPGASCCGGGGWTVWTTSLGEQGHGWGAGHQAIDARGCAEHHLGGGECTLYNSCPQSLIPWCSDLPNLCQAKPLAGTHNMGSSSCSIILRADQLIVSSYSALEGGFVFPTTRYSSGYSLDNHHQLPRLWQVLVRWRCCYLSCARQRGRIGLCRAKSTSSSPWSCSPSSPMSRPSPRLDLPRSCWPNSPTPRRTTRTSSRQKPDVQYIVSWDLLDLLYLLTCTLFRRITHYHVICFCWLFSGLWPLIWLQG